MSESSSREPSIWDLLLHDDAEPEDAKWLRLEAAMRFFTAVFFGLLAWWMQGYGLLQVVLASSSIMTLVASAESLAKLLPEGRYKRPLVTGLRVIYLVPYVLLTLMLGLILRPAIVVTLVFSIAIIALSTVATGLSESAAVFLAATATLFGIAYASQWLLVKPVAWFQQHGPFKSEPDNPEEAELQLLVLSLIDPREVAYILGILAFMVVLVTGYVTGEGSRPEWLDPFGAITQALLLFVAVDTYLMTFRKPWLDRRAEQRRRQAHTEIAAMRQRMSTPAAEPGHTGPEGASKE